MSALLQKSLLPGDRVRVGRKPSAEVFINRPYISGVHCELEVTTSPEGTHGCHVCDQSHNGTWLLRAGLPAGSLKERAVRLRKDVREELRCGDRVLLLSPYHNHCLELIFTLERGDGEFVLRQLPVSEGRAQTEATGRKRRLSESDTAPSKFPRLDKENVGRVSPKTNDDGHVVTESITHSPPTPDGPHSPPPHSHTLTPDGLHSPPRSHTPTPEPVHKGDTKSADDELEHCPHCLQLFPLDKLLTHCDLCTLPHPQRYNSLEMCPVCLDWFSIPDLVSHADSCSKGSKEEVDGTEGDPPSPVVTDSGRRYTLEPYEGSTHNLTGSGRHVTANSESAGEVAVDVGAAKPSESCRCPHCSELVAPSALKTHLSTCSKSPGLVEEHCQHCLEVFPLEQLVEHSLNCVHRKNLGSLEGEVEANGVVSGEEVWGEPVERCMHCFRDFPLSKLVVHCQSCEGDMLGPRERFRGFLPSVHDMDPMALSVLTETQMAAVEYVMERSKVESESVFPALKHKVLSLGYSERDLEMTLQWIRRDAPIIVHVNLDRVLRFLVEDTHYRNLFEVGTGGGSTDTRARGSWENRIFNNIYSSSPPVERVKYGVLNIVGDPRGVQSCYSYGDSFLQLKKVRLRTTFASTDTSSSAVQLSCCEYYGNVLNQYNSAELQAILDVATRKQPFLRSNIITQYKEVQIHGPLCLSENVDCIVVNERHASDPPTRELLDRFVDRNKCNLLWMEPADAMGYPSFTPTAPHFMTTPIIAPYPHYPLVPAPLTAPVGPPPPDYRVYRRRRRRRHGRYRDHW